LAHAKIYNGVIQLKEERGKSKTKTAQAIVFSVVMLAILSTFIIANRFTGSYATITGNSAVAVQKATGLENVVGLSLFALVCVAALVMFTRIGQTQIQQVREVKLNDINGTVKKAEVALREGNHVAAYSLYNTIRDQYAKLKDEEKIWHHDRIMGIHKELSRQTTLAEANYLTQKYVNNTITQAEFERLRQLIINQ
jgi:hypothetical protein